MKKSDKRMVAIQMAKENIAKFFVATMTDKALAAKLVVLAVENGYDFTAEELLELGAARPISENEASAVSGGIYLPFGSVLPGFRK